MSNLLQFTESRSYYLHSVTDDANSSITRNSLNFFAIVYTVIKFVRVEQIKREIRIQIMVMQCEVECNKTNKQIINFSCRITYYY